MANPPTTIQSPIILRIDTPIIGKTVIKVINTIMPNIRRKLNNIYFNEGIFTPQLYVLHKVY